jgi:acetyl esterase/lipase
MRAYVLRLLLVLVTLSSPTVSAEADDKASIRPDVVYGHKDGMALTFDVFTPKENAKGIGLLFMVSGGWVSAWAPPEQSINLFRPMIDAGYTVLAVRHGSSPRYVVPEVVADVKLALDYVGKHADDLQIDRKKLGVFGFSAGGHLSLILGTQSNDQSTDEAPRVGAVVAVFPPTDLAPYVEIGNPRREQFPALRFEPADAPKVSPLLSVTSDDAPTLLFHGDKDELVPLWHSEKINEAFKEAKVATKLVVFEGAAHGFNQEQNIELVKGLLDWFNEHLK